MISCQKVINHFSNSRATTSKWRLLSFQALWWSATTDNIFDKTLTSRKIQKANKNNESNHCVKCPNTELFLVRIFLYSDRIQENTDQKWLRIWTLFTHYVSRFCSPLLYKPRHCKANLQAQCRIVELATTDAGCTEPAAS